MAPDDHAVWLVIGAVDRLDTSAVHAVRRTGGAGARGYDPQMLVTLLIWAYASGVTSSRRTGELCRTDVAFRVICAQDVPDHVTIARFRAAFPDLARELFTQVLMLCARLGMGQVGTVALDGTKIAASASKAANRTEERLRALAAQRAGEHAAQDAAEDERFGEGRRGDRLPPGGAGGGSRDERIRKAMAELEAERQAARAARDGEGPGLPGRGSRGKDAGRTRPGRRAGPGGAGPAGPGRGRPAGPDRGTGATRCPGQGGRAPRVPRPPARPGEPGSRRPPGPRLAGAGPGR
jgi:transposase